MVKKIKKYAKFIVCVALIMGLIAPSYAALSASDGSAFVTKAEFDSALADFNARLTTFEAGINSKIDSQVTSYLDRNGIWNGKDQDLDASGGADHHWIVTAKDICDISKYTVKNGAAFLTLKGVPNISRTVYLEGSVELKAAAETFISFDFTDPFYQVLVPKVSKSGMVFLQVKQDPYDKVTSAPVERQLTGDGFRDYGRWQTLIEVGTSVDYSDAPATLKITRYMGVYRNGNKNDMVVSATSNLVDYNLDITHWGWIKSDYTSRTPYMFMYGPLDWKTGRIDVYQFFVSKGDSIVYGLGGQQSRFVLRTLFCNGWIDGINIMDCKVY